MEVLGPISAVLGGPRPLLGPLGAVLGRSEAALGAYVGGLGRFGVALGAAVGGLGQLWGLCGRSWRLLGRSWTALGTLLGHRGPALNFATLSGPRVLQRKFRYRYISSSFLHYG